MKGLRKTLTLAFAFFCGHFPHIAGAYDPGYVLSIGDEIEFDVLQEDDLLGQFIINSQGFVSLPLIGGVPIAGLNIADAKKLIRDTYTEREVFRSPTIELSVVAYRKVTILGDVLNPGQYDYDPMMTAEHALGKAGGMSSFDVDPELRLLRRRELEAAEASITADIALKSAVYARLNWQLHGGQPEISMERLPDDVRVEVDAEGFRDFAATERELALIENEDFETQVELINEAIEESRLQLLLVEERERIARQAELDAREAAERADELRERGVISSSDQLALRAALSAASSTLIGVAETKTAIRRELGAFERELSDLKSAHHADLISSMQIATVDLTKLIAEKQSVQDQLDLIAQWMLGGPNEQDTSKITFSARRLQSDGSHSMVSLEPFDEMRPGDVLTVSVTPSDLGLRLGQ